MSRDVREQRRRFRAAWADLIGRCAYCGETLEPGQVSLEHVAPQSRVSHTARYRKLGRLVGTIPKDHWSNWVGTCSECNSARSDLPVYLYRAALRGFWIEWAHKADLDDRSIPSVDWWDDDLLAALKERMDATRAEGDYGGS